MPAIHPSVRSRDVDSFEDRLTAFLREATPDEIREAVYQASVFIENVSENGTARDNLDQVNNATSTIGRCTATLIRRLAELEKRLAAPTAEVAE